MPIVRACRQEEFEPQNEIGIYLQVRNSFDFQRGLCVIIPIDEHLSYSKVDSYVVVRLKHFMSACSDNGHRKYNERRRSESLLFQMQIKKLVSVSALFALDRYERQVLDLVALEIQEIESVFFECIFHPHC